MILAMFETSDHVPTPFLAEVWLEHVPRIGDALVFDSDESADGEPVQYRVADVRWVITSQGAEASVRLSR